MARSHEESSGRTENRSSPLQLLLSTDKSNHFKIKMLNMAYKIITLKKYWEKNWDRITNFSSIKKKKKVGFYVQKTGDRVALDEKKQNVSESVRRGLVWSHF